MKKVTQQARNISQWIKAFRTLNESQKRWFAAQKASELGWGGITKVQELTHLSRPTIMRGIRELQEDKALGVVGRVRQYGGGRKCLDQEDDTLLRDMESILIETTAGDPMGSLKWTAKSAEEITLELQSLGHIVSPRTIDRFLNQMGYSLQANRKTIEGKSHPDRNAQFDHIQVKVKNFTHSGDPVISVDSKKKNGSETSKILAKYG